MTETERLNAACRIQETLTGHRLTYGLVEPVELTADEAMDIALKVLDVVTVCRRDHWEVKA